MQITFELTLLLQPSKCSTVQIPSNWIGRGMIGFGPLFPLPRFPSIWLTKKAVNTKQTCECIAEKSTVAARDLEIAIKV